MNAEETSDRFCPYGADDCPKVRALRSEIQEVRDKMDFLGKIGIATIVLVVAFHGTECLAVLGGM